MARVFNFSAGPATLPTEVLEEAQAELTDYQGSGMSIAEVSHRGKAYSAVHEEAVEGMRELLGVPAGYSVIFMQGGATGQFGFVPMNLLPAGETADYINSGSWAKKAILEASLWGQVNVVADTGSEIPARFPGADELQRSENAAYLHLTSNETIAGTQWKTFPASTAPVVADMSSDILSRPLDVSQFGLIYAGAQKNLSMAGVTLVVIRDDLMERAPSNLPKIFRYKTHAEANSLYHTPPTFGIYITALVVRWIRKMGIENLYQQNVEKAAKLYAAIDGTGFYAGTAVPEWRSDMNVTFRLQDPDLEPIFLAEADAAGLMGLKGHRSVGGVRASIYNAFPVAGVEALVAFMQDFERTRG